MTRHPPAEKLHRLKLRSKQPKAKKKTAPRRLLEFDPTPGLATPIRKVAKSVWESVRKRRLKENGNVCQICKYVAADQKLLHCHEVYAYRKTVIGLKRVDVVCYRCHDVMHIYHTHDRIEKTACEAPVDKQPAAVARAERYLNELFEHYRRSTAVFPPETGIAT